MIETAIVDGDIIAYRTAAVTENSDVALALWQASEMMQRILHETNSMDCRCYLSGGSNFRYNLYPDYKANRRDIPKPRHLQPIREHLVVEWKATVTDGIEADDAMGIDQCANENTMICTVDKDLLMIPGWHYNFVKQQTRLISPLDGLRNFYTQLIMGDRADNVKGYDGKMRDKVPNFLQHAVQAIQDFTTEWDMCTYVRDMYRHADDNDERFLMNARVLWIQRKEDDTWNFPVEGAIECNE